MPLDPQAKGFLKLLADSGVQPLETLTPAEARVVALRIKLFRGALEEVGSIEYRFIPGPTADLPVWIYRPHAKANGPQPALIHFHGGGWVIANIEIADHVSRNLANRTGCVIIAVNYQKAPEHKFPIPLNDCYAATQWVFDNAADLGLDATRIGVIGDSAGGNLAAAVTLKARDEHGPKLAYQVLVYPALQHGCETPSAVANATGYHLERATMEYFWNHYANSASDGQNPYCCPLVAADHSGLPPALIACAEFDPLCDDGRSYADKLQAAGVPVKFSLYEGMIHGFFWLPGVFDRSRDLFDEIGREVRSALG